MRQESELKRKNMIDGQVLPNHVTDGRIIQTLSLTPRENFVPAEMRGIAYLDDSIPLGHGRYLPSAMIIGRMMQLAGLKETDVVLNIGCGTGYTVALLGQVTGTVIGLERDQTMIDTAERQLRDLGICNAAIIRQDDLQKGYPQQGPYDVIFVNGSVPSIPEALTAQLKPDGRLLAIVSTKRGASRAVMIFRSGKTLLTKSLFDAAMPVLGGFEQKEGFVF